MQRESRNIVTLLTVLAVLIWTADAFFDAIADHGRTFNDLLAGHIPVRDLAFRLLFIALVTFTVYQFIRLRDKGRGCTKELHKHMAAVEASMDGIAILNEKHEYLYVNDSYARITGFDEPRTMVGRSFGLIYDEHQLGWIEQNVFPSLEREGRWQGELAAHRKDGTVFAQEASITRLPDNSCVCVMRDATERSRRGGALERSERLLNSIFASIQDPFCVFDENYRIVKVNAAYAELKQNAVDELLDRTCFQVLEGRDSVCDGCVIRKTFQSGDPCAKEKKVALKTGETLWLEIFTYPILDEQGKPYQVIEYTRDVTDRKKSEEDRKRLISRLEYLSSVDGLTGLLNRRALSEQLEYEIERVRRFNAPLTIILCDLDNLKKINDQHGHLAGDTAIQLVSATLRNALRSVDIAGRYGGDEFLVLLPETPIAGAKSLAEKIHEEIQKTELRLKDADGVTLSLSMGIASLRPLPEGIDGIISRVDAALYESKHAGRNRITVVE